MSNDSDSDSDDRGPDDGELDPPPNEPPRAAGTDRHRNRRTRADRGPRPRTVFLPMRTNRTAIAQMRAESATYDEEFAIARPRTRAECEGGERPCPWVGCRHHLYLEVTFAGSLKIVRPAIELENMIESCSLDVADLGIHTLEIVGDLLNVSRERVRQEEVKALVRLRAGVAEVAA